MGLTPLKMQRQQLPCIAEASNAANVAAAASEHAFRTPEPAVFVGSPATKSEGMEPPIKERHERLRYDPQEADSAECTIATPGICQTVHRMSATPMKKQQRRLPCIAKASNAVVVAAAASEHAFRTPEPAVFVGSPATKSEGMEPPIKERHERLRDEPQEADSAECMIATPGICQIVHRMSETPEKKHQRRLPCIAAASKAAVVAAATSEHGFGSPESAVPHGPTATKSEGAGRPMKQRRLSEQLGERAIDIHPSSSLEAKLYAAADLLAKHLSFPGDFDRPSVEIEAFTIAEKAVHLRGKAANVPWMRGNEAESCEVVAAWLALAADFVGSAKIRELIPHAMGLRGCSLSMHRFKEAQAIALMQVGHSSALR